jgi:2-dehydro-3-deoxygluconokinase
VGAGRPPPDDAAFLKAALVDAGMLYFSGITLAILTPPKRRRLMKEIAARRKAGAKIAFDPNFRPVLWPDKKTARAAVEAAYRVADIALPTFSDAHALFGDRSVEQTMRRLLDAGIEEFVIKNGDKPALVFGDAKRGEVPPMRPKKMVDTTGAGDSFSGAYLAGRTLGLDPLRAARLGHAVAAEVVGVHGALAKIDGKKALERALAS